MLKAIDTIKAVFISVVVNIVYTFGVASAAFQEQFPTNDLALGKIDAFFYATEVV